jgi:tryptophan synthase alpha chain
MSRLQHTFERLAADHRAGLITYVTGGDPDLARSARIIAALDRAGADIIEVGVPFSDPLADGPVIQRASERALAAGSTLSSTLDLIGSLRDQVRAPMVLFSYANPIHRMGYDTFARRAADAGVDGVLTLDLPAEESADLRQVLRESGVDVIFLLSPTTTMARMELAGQLGSGFLYAISRLGVTGARSSVAAGVEQLVARIRQAASLPVAVGFGISRPDQVREVGQWADAVVVGSALVQVIADSRDAPDLDERVEAYVRWLTGRPGI